MSNAEEGLEIDSITFHLSGQMDVSKDYGQFSEELGGNLRDSEYREKFSNMVQPRLTKRTKFFLCFCNDKEKEVSSDEFAKTVTACSFVNSLVCTIKDPTEEDQFPIKDSMH